MTKPGRLPCKSPALFLGLSDLVLDPSSPLKSVDTVELLDLCPLSRCLNEENFCFLFDGRVLIIQVMACVIRWPEPVKPSTSRQENLFCSLLSWKGCSCVQVEPNTCRKGWFSVLGGTGRLVQTVALVWLARSSERGQSGCSLQPSRPPMLSPQLDASSGGYNRY